MNPIQHPSPSLPLLAAAALAVPLASRAPADVLVVDQANGRGADFTSIAAAVAAAADGDVLLVRSGSYGPFAVDGKGLVIQEDAGASVAVVSGGIEVRNLAVGQFVALRGIDAAAGQLGPALTLQSCAGAVLVEDARLSGTSGVPFPGGGIQVTQCASVVLARCLVPSFESQFLSPGLDLQGSSITLHATTVHGPKGFDQAAGTPNTGGVGVRLSASVLVATDATIVGGAGGNYVGPPVPCRDGGAGGTGLALSAGSTATLFASTVLGGPGGLTLGTCAVGPLGGPSTNDGTATLTQSPASLGRLVLSSPVRSGMAYDLDVTGEPGASAWALYGTELMPGLSFGSLLGVLHAPLAPFQFESLGVLPPGGALSFAFTAATPPGSEGFAFYAQLLTLSPSDGRLRLGTGSAITFLDASL